MTNKTGTRVACAFGLILIATIAVPMLGAALDIPILRDIGQLLFLGFLIVLLSSCFFYLIYHLLIGLIRGKMEWQSHD
jgi:hypothetical protein